MLDPDQSFHPRSPVQPDRSPLPYLMLAVVAAFAVWTAWQLWPDASAPAPSRQAAVTKQVPGSPQKRLPLGQLTGLFTAEDYPADAADRNEQGTTQVRLSIDAQGKVAGCAVTKSSGSASLDSATCRIIIARARFAPAQDSDGNAVASSFTQSVTWRLAE